MADTSCDSCSKQIEPYGSVNLGSRLESLTKNYGVDILVGETTMQAASNMLFRQLDRVRVKGKDEPVTIYEPMINARVTITAMEPMTGSRRGNTKLKIRPIKNNITTSIANA